MKKRTAILMLTALTALSMNSYGAELADAANLKRETHAISAAYHLIPTMANTPGRFGAYFKTRVVIFNPASTGYTIEVDLYDSNGFVKNRLLNIRPTSYIVWENFLEEVFEFSGNGAVGFGSPSAEFRFFVTAEVYNDSPNGRYTTVVSAGGQLDSFFGSSRPVSVGINVNDSTRTNIGVFNSQDRPLAVRAVVYDRDTEEVIEFSLPPNGWAQKSITKRFSNGAINWTLSSGAQWSYLWVVSVDNRSGDGTLITPFGG